MRLRYEAVNGAGEAVRGTIDAATAAAATERLYAEGMYVTNLTPEAGGAGAESRALPLAGGGGRLKHVAAITRQLAVLTSTGTPVVQALSAVERQLPAGPARRALADVLRRVEEGSTLAAAMAEHPAYFDPVYRSLIAAGETGGQLARMLDRLGAMTRKQLKVRGTVLGALAYPTMLLGLAAAVVVVMLLVVLPRFTGLFQSLDAPIPPTTRALMAVSASVRSYWWVYGLGAAGAAVAAVAGLRTPAGRRRLDCLLIRLPVFGAFVRSLITARIVRTLGVLLEGKVPLLEALGLTKDAAGNAEYRALLERAEEAVTRGEPMSTVLRDTPLVAPSVYEALVTGERSGQVGPILLNLAEFLDEDNEVVIKSIMSLIEPMILIVLGVAVGFVALSLFLPLFDLTSAAQGGGA